MRKLPEVLSIKVLPLGDQAQASCQRRLREKGASSLDDSELLACVFGASSDRLAFEAMLSAAGGLKGLCTEDLSSLASRRDMGAHRATALHAAVELGRRALVAKEPRPRLRSPEEVYAYLAPRLSALPREVFHVLCLNNRNVLLKDARVAEGAVDSCAVDPREVYRAALLSRCTAIILAHNHPSGDAEPSSQDIALTQQLVEGAKLVGIRVLDHVIVGDGTFVSMNAGRHFTKCG